MKQHGAAKLFLCNLRGTMRPSAIASFFAGLILSASIVLTGSARGQGSPELKPIGRVMTATGSVTIEHADAVVVQANLASGGAGQTKVGDLVYKGDVVQTGPNSAIGVTFTDGTAFNLISNSRMVLNEFVYDPNGKANSTFFTLVKGTFTFVAGKVAKSGDMKIDTPAATLGIRGTTPHVEIRDDGTVSYSTLMEEGKTKAMQKRGAIDNRGATGDDKSGQPPAAPSVGRVKRNPDRNLNICKGC
jgi:hypothetical protein